MKTFNEWMNAEFGILKYPPEQYNTWEGWANYHLQKPSTVAKNIVTLRINQYNQYVKDNIEYMSIEEYMHMAVGKKSKGTWEEWLADPNNKVYQDIWYPKYQEYKEQLLAAALFSVPSHEEIPGEEIDFGGPQPMKIANKKLPVSPKKPIRMLN